jgi:hypothetical protein
MAHRFTLSLFALWVLVCGFRTGVADAADVLTQHNDNARTGTNLDEKELTRSSVRSASFGRLWTLYADGQVVAQPLYVSQLAIDVGSEEARLVTLALTSVRRSNWTCSFPASSFHGWACAA